MAPVTNHTIVVKIDNVDKSSILLADSLYVRSSISNGTDVAEFALRDVDQNYTPADWDEVTIDVNGTRIFGGYIIQREADSIGAGSQKRAVWRIQCKDWSILLDRVIVNKQYKLTDDSAILSNLFSIYLSGEGFDAATNVNTVRQDVDIAFEEVALRDALNSLAVRAGANWHIAPNKSLYWYAPSAPASAAFNIDTDAPNNSTTFNVLEQSLRKTIDSSQIINRVRVIGAEAASTSLQTDTFAANGSDSVFGPLTKKPHSIWLVQYTVGGTNVSAYASQVGLTANNDKLYDDGGTFSVIANLDARLLKITDVGSLVPDNATNVTVKYYYTTPVEVTRNDTASQTAFGRVFEQSIYDESLTSAAEAQAYADSLLEEYANGRETIRFDVARHGLLPGRKINVKNTLLALNADYLIQEVQFRGVAVSQNAFMVVASVQAGKFVQSLIDTLKPGYSAGAGRTPARNQPGRLSNIAIDMGEIVAGRAAFTDGGTAKFEWGTPNGATGAVIGLEDKGGNAYGAAYIYEAGTVRAKLGRLTDLPPLGTITPTGWGLYTTNGFFSGQVVASSIIGGTITGNTINGGTVNGGQITGGTINGAQISGGTVTGGLFTGGTINVNTGTIGGWRINGTHLWSIGGSISTSQVVNSANPGVYLSTAGLFGFGTLGMTFGIWTDPARAPWFSSGTINNVVYEVYEAAVIRTNENVFADGGIQMDNSGIFGVSPIAGYSALALENGDALLLEDGRGIELYGLKFALDSVTGRLYAEDAVIQGDIYARSGYFSGDIEASNITGGTITGASLVGVSIVGQVISGSDLVGGTITGIPIADAGITNGSLSTSLILGGTMTAAQIVGGTITGGVFTGGNTSGGTVSAARFNGGTVTGALVSGGTVTGGQISGGTVTGARVNGGTVSGGLISGGTVSGGVVSGGTVTGAVVSGGTVSGSRITGGTITGVSISGNTVSGGTVSGGLVSGGTVSGATVTGSQMSGGTITSATFTGGVISVASGSVVLDSSGLRFPQVTAVEDNNISWQTGGTTIARVFVERDGPPATYFVERIGENIYNADNMKRTIVWGGGSTSWSDIQQRAGTVSINFSHLPGGTVLAVAGSETLARNVVPLYNNSSFGLGNSSAGWAYIYMRSPNGTRWQVTVDNSGNLVVT